MNRKLIPLLVGVLALAFAGIALAASGPAKTKLRKTAAGKILTNGSGFTVYMFTRDTRNHDKCMSIRFCTTTWPPVTTKASPSLGPASKPRCSAGSTSVTARAR